MTLALRPKPQAALVERARKLIDDDPVSLRTKKAYATDWRAFRAWCRGAGVLPIPPSEGALLLYLTHLSDEGLKLTTIERAQAGIVHTWRRRGHEWIATYKIHVYWKNLRRARSGSVAKKEAISPLMLGRMVGALPPGLRGVRDRAILTLGFTGAFRRSEIVSLDVEDVAFRPEGMIVTVRRSKTDQEGKGYEKGIPSASDSSLCATASVALWIKSSGISTGALFRAVVAQKAVEARLTDGSIARIVKSAARRAGLHVEALAGHSLRAGFMTSAAEAGRDLDEMMRQSGHRSERIARGYIRHGTLFTKNAAKGLL